VKEVSTTVLKQKMVNEDELQKNCQFFVKRNVTEADGNITTKYLVIFDPKNNSQITYLIKKYGVDIDWYVSKETSFPYLVISQPENNKPTASVDTIGFSRTKNLADDNHIIQYSTLSNALEEAFLDHNFILSSQEFNEFLNLYVNFFNSLGLTIHGDFVYVRHLKVGDEIIFQDRYRRHGSGERLKVTRVAEKSLQLSNGKRIPRDPDSWNRVEFIHNKKYKIVGGPLTIETRWVRKRIV